MMLGICIFIFVVGVGALLYVLAAWRRLQKARKAANGKYGWGIDSKGELYRTTVKW